jgi:hypothetical protein
MTKGKKILIALGLMSLGAAGMYVGMRVRLKYVEDKKAELADKVAKDVVDATNPEAKN